MISAIRVEGLNRFSRSMRKVSADFPKRMRASLNETAKIVATEARARVPKKDGTLAGTIRPSSTTRMARVSMGGAKAPYAGFIEFGGRVGRNKSIKREFIKDGRYLYPAFFAKRDAVQHKLSSEIGRLIEDSG